MVEHPEPFRLFAGQVGGGGGVPLTLQSPPPSEQELPFHLQATELDEPDPGM